MGGASVITTSQVPQFMDSQGNEVRMVQLDGTYFLWLNHIFKLTIFFLQSSELYQFRKHSSQFYNGKQSVHGRHLPKPYFTNTLL